MNKSLVFQKIDELRVAYSDEKFRMSNQLAIARERETQAARFCARKEFESLCASHNTEREKLLREIENLNVRIADLDIANEALKNDNARKSAAESDHIISANETLMSDNNSLRFTVSKLANENDELKKFNIANMREENAKLRKSVAEADQIISKNDEKAHLLKEANRWLFGENANLSGDLKRLKTKVADLESTNVDTNAHLSEIERERDEESLNLVNVSKLYDNVCRENKDLKRDLAISNAAMAPFIELMRKTRGSQY